MLLSFFSFFTVNQSVNLAIRYSIFKLLVTSEADDKTFCGQISFNETSFLPKRGME